MQERQMSSLNPPQLLLDSGAFVLPHPDKVFKGGEDWFFVSSSCRAIGIADGVGGWAEVNIDPAVYARSLMKNASEEADAQLQGSSSLSAQAILEKAVEKTLVMGSSTACVVAVNGSTLVASNLGDSGFLILRGGEIALKTAQQQHKFNFPYQCGAPGAGGDSPAAANRYKFDLLPGDLIVMGTDGLWDNCWPEEVQSVVKFCLDKDSATSAGKLAQVISHYAQHRAGDPEFASPFAYSAYESGIGISGGKMDDITVVISRVKESPQGPVASKL
jgi:protein phosphatase PTC7